jgi:hypothetical protein
LFIDDYIQKCGFYIFILCGVCVVWLLVNLLPISFFIVILLRKFQLHFPQCCINNQHHLSSSFLLDFEFITASWIVQ